jgi:uncharacterized protein (TIGR02117 family)
MRRGLLFFAAGLAVILLLALIFAGAAFITARPADPMLWPPRPDARAIEIVVVSNGYHTGVALPRGALAEFASGRGYPALIALSQRFAAFDWLEIGWGDEGFYRQVPTASDLTLPLAVRALFGRANPTVLHVAGLTDDPVRVFPAAGLVRVPLSMTGFDQMLARVDATFVPPVSGALPDLGRGLYGSSLFYRATGSFNILHLCNHWVDELLGAAGLPTAPVLATFSHGLMLNLSWRAGLRPKPPQAGTKGAT